MIPQERKYWFPAKRFGWGWGPPTAWQGWAVLLVYLSLVLGGIPLIQVPLGSLIYMLYALSLTALFVGVCWLMGEPPAQHRGERDA